MKNVLDKRFLPIEYIPQFYQKPELITWERFSISINQQFKKTQERQLLLNEKKRLEREEKERERKLKLEQQEREQREKEKLELDRKRKQEEEEAEQRERQRVEEAECKVKEERERQEKEAKESVEKIALSACADFIDVDEENEDNEDVEEPLAKQIDQPLLKQIKTEKEDGARDKQPNPESKMIQEQNELIKKIYDVNEQDYQIAVKNYDLNKEIENYLNKVGTLIVHPDVVYALENLQKIGATMRRQQGQTPAQETTSGAASSNVAVGPRNLFPSDSSNIMDLDKVASEIKQENGSLPGKGSEDVVNPALTSPPPAARMFLGMKRHTPQSFTEVISTKKRKVSTPARKNIGSPVVSPFRPTSSVAECIAKAESICKLSDAGNTFLKKKKITPTHSQAICDAVGQYNRNIVEFNESHQSFFKIMTYYYPAIGMIPEDVRYLELRRQLFDFVMKNAEYTKVNSKALIQ